MATAITVDSAHRQPGGVYSSFRVNFLATYSGKRIFFEAASIPVLWNNISDSLSNGSLVLQELDNSQPLLTASIAPGVYTAVTFIAAWQTALNALAGSVLVYTVTLEPLTNLLKIAANGLFTLRVDQYGAQGKYTNL